MFDKKLINSFLIYLWIISIFLFFIAIITGFIQANWYYGNTAWKVWYFIWFVGSSSIFFTFFYSILAVLYKINNLEFNKDNKIEKD